MIVNKRLWKTEELKIKGATLLSREEVTKYLTKEERVYKGWWWLSTPGSNIISNAIIYQNGDCAKYCTFVVDGVGYVRPALKIVNLKSSNFNVGDIFEINGYEFRIISPTLAWMFEQDIGTSEFNVNPKKGNNYSKSYIKKYIDKWFKKEILKEEINNE